MVAAWTAPDAGKLNKIRESLAGESPAVPNSLKICLITETLHAGVGRHIVDTARALAAKNHQVHILYSDRRMDRNFLAAIQSHPGIRHQMISMPRGICSGDIAAFRRINAYVKAHGPFDIVHGESSKGGGYARLLKLFGAKTIIYSPHAFVTLSPVVPGVKKLMYHAIEFVLAHLTNRIICSSYSEQEHARRLGISKNRLAMIFNGSDPIQTQGCLHTRAALGIAPERIVIGYAGRMEDQKAPNRLIDAALLLLPKIPQLHLLMIGEGPKREYLEARMRKAGLADRASWLGAVNARHYMPAMDIFVLPSRYEGFPYVLLEAIHAGLPVVSTPVGGAIESVEPGVNGIIVPHNDPKKMAAALQQLALDTDLRQTMARASKERAAKFSIPRMVSAIEHLYLESCGRLVDDLETETSRALTGRPLNAANATR